MRNRPLFLLIISAVLVSVGMFISYYGSEVVTQKLATTEKEIGVGNSIEITKELDPDKGETGVYVVQMIGSKDGSSVRFSLYDAFNGKIIQDTLNVESIEKKFDINTKGDHRLLIENTSKGSIRVAAALGYMPTSESFSLSIVGVFAIMAGLVGLAIGLVYFLKSRKIPGQE